MSEQHKTSEHDKPKPEEALPTEQAAATFAQPDDLHNLFAMPLNMDDEDPLAAMRDDPNYGALIKELEYIAAQARQLFALTEEVPSDKVWEGIAKELNSPNEEKE